MAGKTAVAEKKKNRSTEEKLKEAAERVFTKKGYAATTTRDIADTAGLNLALFHYYFRSKEKLFETIMLEKIQQLFAFMAPALNDHDTTLAEKIEWIADHYIGMLLKNPDLPLFVLSEIRTNPGRFGKTLQLDTTILKSHFMKQVVEKKKDIQPTQLFLNFLGMMIFPFIIKPVFQATGVAGDEEFRRLMEERKAMVPIWFKMMLK